MVTADPHYRQRFVVSREGRLRINSIDRDHTTPITVILNWSPGR